MSAVAAPADRRFRRAHVKPARKQRNWWNGAKVAGRYLLISLVVVYGVYRGTSVMAHARVLTINRIVVGGNRW